MGIPIHRSLSFYFILKCVPRVPLLTRINKNRKKFRTQVSDYVHCFLWDVDLTKLPLILGKQWETTSDDLIWMFFSSRTCAQCWFRLYILLERCSYNMVDFHYKIHNRYPLALQLTHWPWGDREVFSSKQFPYIVYWVKSRTVPVKLPLYKCQLASLMIIQHWFG